MMNINSFIYKKMKLIINIIIKLIILKINKKQQKISYIKNIIKKTRILDNFLLILIMILASIIRTTNNYLKTLIIILRK